MSALPDRPVRRRLLLCLLALAPLGASPAAAETRWRMATEYPASAISGEGIATFARLVAEGSGGALAIETSFDAKAGIKSAEMIAAVEAGRIEAADAFGGALAGTDPLLGLSSLPFVTRSIDDARRLAALARPAYERAFAAHGQRLLYVTPWPPTGLWTKVDLASVAVLRSLSVRAYDATSADVLTRAGARATSLSFADAMPRLKDGSVDSVLSSGDGGAGRNLWDLLPHFAEINYAQPHSFATLNGKAYDALAPELRRVVDEAAVRVEARQWEALRTRLDENYARMRANGVAIRTTLDPELAGRLREAGRASVADWRAKAGPAAAAILDAFGTR